MGVEMWCRRPSICSLLFVLSGALVVLLLVAAYNGQTDFARHTPLTHNAKVLNIQQKVFKSKLLPNNEIIRQGLEKTSGTDHHGNDSDDTSWSSSDISENEEEERPSDRTGDDAREVRVSSSTDDAQGESEDDRGDDDDDDGGVKTRPSVADDDRGRETDVNNPPPGIRTSEDQRGTDVGEEEEDDGRENVGDGDGDDDGENSRQRTGKHQYHHNWDEYDRMGWKSLPVMQSISDAEAQPGASVVYNRVGKCGSRSVISVMRELATRNHFHFVSSLVYNRTRISPPHERMIVSVVSRLERPYIFQRHVHFIDFRRYSIKQPKYINIIRDPLSRMVSHYYFKRFGDGKSDRQYSGSDKYQTFDECVLKREEECLGKKSFYIIPFFCGQDPGCKDATSWSLDEAIRNFNDHYVAVGVLEELEDTFRVFEKVLPGIFAGALDVYKQTVNGELSQKVTSTLTKHKVKPSPRVVRIMREHMKLEYIFYEYIKSRFHAQKKRLGIS